MFPDAPRTNITIPFSQIMGSCVSSAAPSKSVNLRWRSQWGEVPRPSRQAHSAWKVSPYPWIDEEITKQQRNYLSGHIPLQPLIDLISEYGAYIFFIRSREMCGGSWRMWVSPKTFGHIDFERERMIIFFPTDNWTPKKATAYMSKLENPFRERLPHMKLNYLLWFNEKRQEKTREVVQLTEEGLLKNLMLKRFDEKTTSALTIDFKALAFEFCHTFMPEYLHRRDEQVKNERDRGKRSRRHIHPTGGQRWRLGKLRALSSRFSMLNKCIVDSSRAREEGEEGEDIHSCRTCPFWRNSHVARNRRMWVGQRLRQKQIRSVSPFLEI